MENNTTKSKIMENLVSVFNNVLSMNSVTNPFEKLSAWAKFLLLHKQGKISLNESHRLNAEGLGKLCIASKDLVKVVEQLDGLKPQKEDYLALFDMLKNNESYRFSFFSQPAEIGQLARRLIGNCKSIFDPFAGVLSETDSFGEVERVLGLEINPNVLEVAALRTALAEKEGVIDFQHKDAYDWTDQKFDAIVSFPPILAYNPQGGLTCAEWLMDQFSKTDTAEKLFVVTTRDFPFSQRGIYMNLRKSLLEKNMVDIVVSLPSELFKATSISMVAIVLDKNRPTGKGVTVIDTSNKIINDSNMFMIEVDEILKSEYDRRKIIVSKEKMLGNHCSFAYDDYTSLSKE